MTGGRSFFILTTARCGSTSLARILDAATNGSCAVEPNPNLNVESRLAMDGRLDDSARVVREILLPRVQSGLTTNAIYGEKNLTYGPFIPEIHAQFEARFVALRRDGREVVRSLIDWHNRMFGDIYRECVELGELSQTALCAAANLPSFRDTSDFARPRPLPGEPWHLEWPTLSRFEMCAYYWSRLNELYLDQLDQLPRDTWIELDYTTPKASDVLEVAAFLGLQGLTASAVESMLDSRINSLKDRCDEAPQFPQWMNWHGGLRRQFERMAGRTMRRLGYWSDGRSPWAAPEVSEDQPEDASSEHVHALAQWLNKEARVGRSFAAATSLGAPLPVEVRCGNGSSDRLLRIQSVTANGREHPETALAVSCGALDSTPDIDAHLDAVVNAAHEAIFVTSAADSVSNSEEHAYRWSVSERRFHALPSPQRVREHLEARGCREIVIDHDASQSLLRISARISEATRHA